MKVADYIFKTPTVTICYDRDLETLYDGSIENIPELLLKYSVIRVYINKVKNFTLFRVLER